MQTEQPSLKGLVWHTVYDNVAYPNGTKMLVVDDNGPLLHQ